MLDTILNAISPYQAMVSKNIQDFFNAQLSCSILTGLLHVQSLWVIIWLIGHKLWRKALIFGVLSTCFWAAVVYNVPLILTYLKSWKEITLYIGICVIISVVLEAALDSQKPDTPKPTP